MPSRNIIKSYTPNTFYHIYNRGMNKESLFLDDLDNKVFLSLFDRYLNPNSQQLDCNKRPYEKFSSIELNAYCLMGNHYHLLVHVNETPSELSAFMRAVGNSYTSYFNKKYSHIGSIFQSRYKAVPISTGEQLAHLTRYIHLNPEQFLKHPYSSVRNYLGEPCSSWLKPDRAIEQSQITNYFEFLKSA